MMINLDIFIIIFPECIGFAAFSCFYFLWHAVFGLKWLNPGRLSGFTTPRRGRQEDPKGHEEWQEVPWQGTGQNLKG